MQKLILKPFKGLTMYGPDELDPYLSPSLKEQFEPIAA